MNWCQCILTYHDTIIAISIEVICDKLQRAIRKALNGPPRSCVFLLDIPSVRQPFHTAPWFVTCLALHLWNAIPWILLLVGTQDVQDGLSIEVIIHTLWSSMLWIRHGRSFPQLDLCMCSPVLPCHLHLVSLQKYLRWLLVAEDHGSISGPRLVIALTN